VGSAPDDGAVTLLSPRRGAARPPVRQESRRRGGPAAPPETVQTPLAAGIGAALWSATLGLAFTTAAVLGTWAAGNRETGGARGALVAGAQGWLLGHGTDLRLDHGSLTLVPLGLTLVFAGLLYRSGVWAGRAAMVQTLREAATATVCLLTVYVAIAVGVAIAARSPGVTPVAPTALTGSAALTLIAGGGGVLRGSELFGTAMGQLPAELRLALRGAVRATLTLLAGGVVVFATSLAWHAQDAKHLYSALGTDVVSAVELIALCVAYAPLGVIWAMTYCIGPGFAVGTGTLVSPSGTSLGDLPAFPLLAALPGEGSAPGLALAGLAVPILAGLVLGVVVGRRSISTAGSTAWIAGGSGVLAGVIAGLLAIVARGGLTQGRMSTLGPNPLVVALWTAVELAAIGGVTAGALRGLKLRRAGHRTKSATRTEDPVTITLPDSADVVLPDVPADEWPTMEIPVVEGPAAESPSEDR
jgi:Family of unknown function (DUF6350)